MRPNAKFDVKNVPENTEIEPKIKSLSGEVLHTITGNS